MSPIGSTFIHTCTHVCTCILQQTTCTHTHSIVESLSEACTMGNIVWYANIYRNFQSHLPHHLCTRQPTCSHSTSADSGLKGEITYCIGIMIYVYVPVLLFYQAICPAISVHMLYLLTQHSRIPKWGLEGERLFAAYAYTYTKPASALSSNVRTYVCTYVLHACSHAYVAQENP